MKISILILLVSLFAAGSIPAQTTAQDWTKMDCEGRGTRLFDELDKGRVIILEYFMMNCIPCVAAANNLHVMIGAYERSNPGVVESYNIGYSDSYNCIQMMEWKTANNLTNRVFDMGAADVTYYGGFGMPTVIVVAGKDHRVLYKSKGWSSSNVDLIKTVIDQYLASTSSVGGGAVDDGTRITGIFPNPATETSVLRFSLKNASDVSVTIHDAAGNGVMTAFTGRREAGENSVRVNPSALPAGTYFIRLKAGDYTGEQSFTVVP